MRNARCQPAPTITMGDAGFLPVIGRWSMSTNQSPLSVMMVAGEASADLHGAELVKELKARGTDDIFGVGGPAMRALGFEARHPAEAISVAGLTEVVFALPRLIRMLGDLVELAVDKRPDVVVLIDLPDFNLRLAKRLKKRGFKVVYYISPQLWAWRKKRVELIKRYVDRMLVILPFEEAFYRSHQVSVDFVGHPLVEEIEEVMSSSDARRHFSLLPGDEVLALLPGSRRKEVERLLPTMLESFQRLRQIKPKLIALIPVASTLQESDLRAQAPAGTLEGVRFVREQAPEVVRASNAAIVCSGTSTLQTALLHTPMVIVYRVSWLTFAILKRLVKVAHIGLVNLIAGKRLVPELIQKDCSPEQIVDAVSPLLHETPERQRMLEGFESLQATLGEPGVSKRVTDILYQESALLPAPNNEGESK